jgi:hypothetical protein
MSSPTVSYRRTRVARFGLEMSIEGVDHRGPESALKPKQITARLAEWSAILFVTTAFLNGGCRRENQTKSAHDASVIAQRIDSATSEKSDNSDAHLTPAFEQRVPPDIEVTIDTRPPSEACVRKLRFQGGTTFVAGKKNLEISFEECGKLLKSAATLTAVVVHLKNTSSAKKTFDISGLDTVILSRRDGGTSTAKAILLDTPEGRLAALASIKGGGAVRLGIPPHSLREFAVFFPLAESAVGVAIGDELKMLISSGGGPP